LIPGRTPAPEAGTGLLSGRVWRAQPDEKQRAEFPQVRAIFSP
jgi:hypothetical protein